MEVNLSSAYSLKHGIKSNLPKKPAPKGFYNNMVLGFVKLKLRVL